jgi:hypothetical protein
VCRSHIEHAIRELEVVLSSPSIKVRDYNKLVDFLQSHAFYLLENDCERINDLIRKIDERVAREYPSDIRIIRSDFVPHSDFDPALYYTKE